MIWTRIDVAAFTLWLDQLTDYASTNNYNNLVLPYYRESFESMSEDRKKPFYDRAKKICLCLREGQIEESHIEG